MLQKCMMFRTIAWKEIHQPENVPASDPNSCYKLGLKHIWIFIPSMKGSVSRCFHLTYLEWLTFYADSADSPNHEVEIIYSFQVHIISIEQLD